MCSTGPTYSSSCSDPYYYNQGHYDQDCSQPCQTTCGSTCGTSCGNTCGTYQNNCDNTYVNDCGRTCGYVCGCGEVAIDSGKLPTCNDEAPKLDVEKLMTPEFKEKVERLKQQSNADNAKLDIIVQDDTPAENLLSV